MRAASAQVTPARAQRPFVPFGQGRGIVYRLAPFPMLPILLESLERSTDKAKTIDAAAAGFGLNNMIHE